MDFKPSRHDEWDGISERRRTAVPAGNPDDPVTREYLEDALMRNRHSTKEYINTKVTELEELIRDGFPNGDPRSHREVHETYIKESEEKSALWKSVREKLISGGVMAAVGFIVVALWNHFLQAITHGPK